MKKTLTNCGLIFISAILFHSCKTIQVPRFVSVEDLYQLKLNSSLEQVIVQLGSKPYNILSSQVDGFSIYTYKYKLVERKVNPDMVNSKGGETTGTEAYNNKEHTAFLIFKDNKLISLITTEGRKESMPLELLNNSLYVVAKEKDKYIIVPNTIEEEKESFSPFVKKKK